MAMQHDKQFKLDAVQYYQDHKDQEYVDVQKILASDTAH